MPCVFRTQIGACVSHTAALLKLDYFRLVGKRTDGSHTILEVEHLSVSIICGIHLLQTRIGIQHRFSRFHTVILYQFAGNANPLAAFESISMRSRLNFFLRKFFFGFLYSFHCIFKKRTSLLHF